MSNTDKIITIVEQQLYQMQEYGYIVPENQDFEVGQAILAAARNIADAVNESLELKQYVRIDGKFYNKEAIQSIIKPKERS